LSENETHDDRLYTLEMIIKFSFKVEVKTTYFMNC